MQRVSAVIAVLALLCLCVGAQAVAIDTVRVGDSGNAGDTQVMTYYDGTTGYGSVSYAYDIGKYEVTAAQYVEFLNAKAKTDAYGLYNTLMGTDSAHGCQIQRSGSSGSYTYSVASDYANRPVDYVSYWDTCRFANWLNNGQGSGDTETGAYTLTDAGITNNTVARNAQATWAVTSENEWYKAAYYKGGGPDAGYWSYAIQSNSIDIDKANFRNIIDGHTTVGGSYGYASAYGTLDQSGNVWEWNEGLVTDVTRGVRGGAFNWTDFMMSSAWRGGDAPSDESYNVGFRVTQIVPVPEPSSIIALAGGLISLVELRRRRS
jgi:sulfatase modifying factor 1